MDHPDVLPAVRRIGARAAGAAQDVAHRLETRLERATGHALPASLAGLRRTVRDHPLGTVGIAIAAGYLLGALLWRK